MKRKRTPRQFGQELIEGIMESFGGAYRRHMRGESVEAILILHDIVAAGTPNLDDHVIVAHQKAIRSACAAVDQKVPFDQARAWMRLQLQKRLEEMLNEN